MTFPSDWKGPDMTKTVEVRKDDPQLPCSAKPRSASVDSQTWHQGFPCKSMT